MKAFATLYARLDATNKTNEKLAALRGYFEQAAPADAAWAIYVLSGRKLKRLVTFPALRDWAAEAAGVPTWLFDEALHAVGDLAETIALILPAPTEASPLALHVWIEQHLARLPTLDDDGKRRLLRDAWNAMDSGQRLVWNKMITGSLRVGVSQQLVVRALAEASGHDAATIAHRLMGDWTPSAGFYEAVVGKDSAFADIGRPYPFFLAHPLDGAPEALGSLADWQVEWKWDGIRAQLIRRAGEVFIWTRGEDLATERFPEVRAEAELLPDGVALDGEILAWQGDAVLPFASLQRRIGRKQLGRKLLEEVPVCFLAFDLLEEAGQDIRALPLKERRRRLEGLLAKRAHRSIRLSSIVAAASWEDLAGQREQSRQRNVEGLMLKRLDAPYGVGRVRGPWWKWKINPYSVDAVMVYAQLGHGRRASLFTDYTFAVWHEGELVPFAKAYSGLSDEEIRAVDRFVRNHTIERFGPVRRVEPTLVFEIAFEGIQRSTRHKSGVAVRFPRMAHWRKDKQAAEADTLEALRRLLPT
jgi:DNA ligase-1